MFYIFFVVAVDDLVAYLVSCYFPPAISTYPKQKQQQKQQQHIGTLENAAGSALKQFCVNGTFVGNISRVLGLDDIYTSYTLKVARQVSLVQRP